MKSGFLGTCIPASKWSYTRFDIHSWPPLLLIKIVPIVNLPLKDVLLLIIHSKAKTNNTRRILVTVKFLIKL